MSRYVRRVTIPINRSNESSSTPSDETASAISIDSSTTTSSSTSIVGIPMLLCADCDAILVSDFTQQRTITDPIIGIDFYVVNFTQIRSDGVVLNKVISFTTHQGLVWLCRNCAYRLTMPRHHNLVHAQRELQCCVFMKDHVKIRTVFRN